MAEPRFVAVIDIGKTNAKVALVDLAASAEIDLSRMPNRPVRSGPYPHHDVGGLWEFILDGLADLAVRHVIDAISVTTHGATAALVGPEGLVLPVLDYEHDGPDTLRADYDRLRPAFAESGSPALPCGLNLGAQLFWQSKTFPDAFAKAEAILAYPQYWTWRLTGVMASEATSLGCHTDLWSPFGRTFSSLVAANGWTGLFPPLRPAADRIGTIRPELARRTGLSPDTPVHCGIHDSNASLLPHLIGRKPPFAVVSTGTWVVCMAVGGKAVDLDPGRDTLVNVNAFGAPVPSARFMGGREYELLLADRAKESTPDDLSRVLAQGTMLLPSVQQGCGPFPQRNACWLGAEPEGGERAASVALYLAMMTATCLDLTGAEGPVLVEGSFAGNQAFAAMLSAATGRPVLAQGQSTGTSIGAAMLAAPPGTACASQALPAVNDDPAFRAYAARWRAALA